jgi:hypothetical protein
MPAGRMQAVVIPNPKVRGGQEFVRVALFNLDKTPFNLGGGGDPGTSRARLERRVRWASLDRKAR